MNATRRLSIAALIVACTHLVFGAIVRISGSGMGCGDNWPKCYGYWFPPFSRPDLIVEVSHRYLASILTVTVLTMAFVAFRNRRIAGVGGPRGVLRSALGAVAAVFAAAILGGVTVKMGNAPWATVAHWLVAMTLLAMVATTAIRAGALGGASSLVQRGSARAKRSAFGAAVLAIFAVALGGLTAKYPGAAVGCTSVPMCGANPSVEPAGVHIQLTHRTIAVLLVLHLIGVVMMLRKRRTEEAPVVIRAAYVALGMVLLQLVVASSMVLFHLPPVLRSLHEATGVGIWLSCFVLAYLARRASQIGGGEAAVLSPAPASPAPNVAPSPISPATIPGTAPASFASAPVAAPVIASSVAEETVVAANDDLARDEFANADLANELSACEAPERDVDGACESDADSSELIVAAALDAEQVEVLETVERETIAAMPVAQAEVEAALPTPELIDAELIDEPLIAGEPDLSHGPIPADGPQSVVAPVIAPTLTPLPSRPKHTMAVIIARGADL